jgi:hypothetical protein
MVDCIVAAHKDRHQWRSFFSSTLVERHLQKVEAETGIPVSASVRSSSLHQLGIYFAEPASAGFLN